MSASPSGNPVAVQPKTSDWTVIGTATGLAILGYLPVFLLSSHAIRIQRDIPFGPTELGVLVGSFFLAATVATALGGWVIDRLPARLGRCVCGLLVGIGCAAFCFARAWTELWVIMAGLGVANALCQAISNRGLAETVSVGRRGLGFGLKQAAVPISVLLAGAAAATLGSVLDWRAAFVGGAVVGAVVAVAGLLTPGAPRIRSSAPRAQHRAGRGPMLALTLANAMGSASANAMAAFVPGWVFHRGLTLGQSGILLVGSSLLNAIFRVGGGYRADRRGGRNLPVVAAQLLVGAVAVAAFTVPWNGILVLAVVVAFAIGWSWPGLLLFSVARTNPESAARASTLVQGGGFAGGTIGPPLFGLVAAHTAYEVAWGATAVSFALAAAAVFLARRSLVRTIAERAAPVGR